MEEGPLARGKKNARIERRTIVFIDECGLSERPHRRRTWSPRGETPVLQYHFAWTTLSAIAGVTWTNFYFQLHQGSIKGPQIVRFLKHLKRHVRGKLLIIWDRLAAHRSALVRDFIAAQKGRITVELLPAYAPELNPTEYLWGQWKQHELGNFCPKDLWDLSTEARRAIRRMRRRPTLIAAFWHQAALAL
jgi:transposase